MYRVGKITTQEEASQKNKRLVLWVALGAILFSLLVVGTVLLFHIFGGGGS